MCLCVEVILFENTTHQYSSTFFLVFQALTSSPSIRKSIMTNMSMEHFWNNTEKRIAKFSGKALLQCHFDYQNFHLKWLCRERPANNNLSNGTAKQLKEKGVKAIIYSRLHDFRSFPSSPLCPSGKSPRTCRRVSSICGMISTREEVLGGQSFPVPLRTKAHQGNNFLSVREHGASQVH